LNEVIALADELAVLLAAGVERGALHIEGADTGQRLYFTKKGRSGE
jgi:hypothetical protein